MNEIHVDSNPSARTKTIFFIAFHSIYLVTIVLNLALLFAPISIRIQAFVLYLAFVILSGCSWKCEKKYGSPWRKFSEKFPFFHLMRSYLNLSIGSLPSELANAEKQADAQFIFATFTHGCGAEYRILMDGMLQDVLPNIYHKIRVLTASVLFYIPLVREVALWTGCVDAGRKSAKLNLEKGNSLLILPGGEQEQLLTEYGKEIVYLKRRKGFIKLALQHKVPVVPVYVFGASDLFYTSKLFFRPRFWLVNRFGICIPFCRGLYGSLCPLPKKISIVFGAPKMYEMKGDSPTENEVDEAHDQFMKELELLFDTHKTTYGYGDRKLVIY